MVWVESSGYLTKAYCGGLKKALGLPDVVETLLSYQKGDVLEIMNCGVLFTIKPALSGDKNIIIGRKGSGKSAIFKLIDEELMEKELVIKVTPDQYS